MTGPTLLLFNLCTDSDDPILGFTTGWIREIAKHCVEVEIISMKRGRVDLPSNVTVHSLGKELGYSEPRRAFRFESLLARILHEKPIDGCFVHMAHVLALLGAPLLLVRRIPTALWYAHSASGLTLRMAEKIATTVATPTLSSFPFKSSKTVATGHGIDTSRFVIREDIPIRQSPTRLLAVGRLSPVKGIHLMIKELAALRGRNEVKLRLVGPTLERDRDYVTYLHQQVVDEDLEGAVEFAGDLPPSQIPGEYATADLVVNFSGTALDKVVLEALASGVPVATTNRAARTVVEQIARPLALRTARDLQDAHAWLSALNKEERRELGRRGRELVVREHSLQKLAPRLVKMATGQADSA